MSAYVDTLRTLSQGIRGDSTALEAAANSITNTPLPGAARLYIHQNHLFMTAKEALRATFETVAKLVDPGFFDFLAHGFVAETPPTDPRMTQYGAGFAAYLSNHPSCTEVPFLTDVAALDWAMTHVTHSYETSALDPESISAIPVEDHAQMVFLPRTTIRVLSCNSPVADIWKFAHGQGDVPNDMTTPTWLLVESDHGQPSFEPLTPSEGIFWFHLTQGNSLADAAEAVFTQDQHFDLSTSLGRALSLGLFASVGVRADHPSRTNTMMME